MKKHLLICIAIILLVHCTTSRAECGGHRIFAYAGVGKHDYDGAQPEINLGNPLGTYGAGYVHPSDWSIEYSHVSSIMDSEEGDGLNTWWLKKSWWFTL